MANTKTTKKSVKKPVAAKKSAPKKTVATKKVATSVAPATTTKMVGFRDAIRMFFAKYFEFKGASTRAEYWWVELFNGLVLFLCGALLPDLIFDLFHAPIIASLIWWCAMLYIVAIVIPCLALLSRRTHDAGFSAWVVFIPAIIAGLMKWVALPLAGVVEAVCGIWCLAIMLMPSKKVNNPYRN